MYFSSSSVLNEVSLYLIALRICLKRYDLEFDATVKLQKLFRLGLHIFFFSFSSTSMPHPHVTKKAYKHYIENVFLGAARNLCSGRFCLSAALKKGWLQIADL